MEMREEAELEHRQRMLANAIAASFVTLLIISGYWIVSTLTGVV